MAFAARLASKRKEAEEAGEDSELNEDKGLGSLLQQGKDKESDGQLQNPFADDEDDDEQSDDEDEEDDEGDLGRGENASGQGSSWNRGGWWRGALGTRNDKSAKETFGDGRDSTDSEDEAEGQGQGGNSSDEEFGDFAMPESSGTSAEAGGANSGFDAEREKVLVKPMPVHPPGGGGNKGNFLGLWPFAKKDKDNSPTKEEAGSEKEKTADAAATADKPVEAQAADEVAKEEKEKDATTDNDSVKEEEKAKPEPPVVLSEDGEKVQPAIEAKRRTSIEEPDEGDEVVV